MRTIVYSAVFVNCNTDLLLEMLFGGHPWIQSDAKYVVCNRNLKILFFFLMRFMTSWSSKSGGKQSWQLWCTSYSIFRNLFALHSIDHDEPQLAFHLQKKNKYIIVLYKCIDTFDGCKWNGKFDIKNFLIFFKQSHSFKSINKKIQV